LYCIKFIIPLRQGYDGARPHYAKATTGRDPTACHFAFGFVVLRGVSPLPSRCLHREAKNNRYNCSGYFLRSGGDGGNRTRVRGFGIDESTQYILFLGSHTSILRISKTIEVPVSVFQISVETNTHPTLNGFTPRLWYWVFHRETSFGLFKRERKRSCPQNTEKLRLVRYFLHLFFLRF